MKENKLNCFSTVPNFLSFSTIVQLLYIDLEWKTQSKFVEQFTYHRLTHDDRRETYFIDWESSSSNRLSFSRRIWGKWWCLVYTRWNTLEQKRCTYLKLKPVGGRQRNRRKASNRTHHGLFTLPVSILRFWITVLIEKKIKNFLDHIKFTLEGCNFKDDEIMVV